MKKIILAVTSMAVLLAIFAVTYQRARAGEQTGENVTAPNPHTRLLFPFATNQAGFDTGITISNTSQDPFGTKHESGTCTLYFYGEAAPSAPITTPDVLAGTAYVSLVSVLAPGFQGYFIADCSFYLAHGVAFVSDVGADKLAWSVPGLVLETPRKVRHPRQRRWLDELGRLKGGRPTYTLTGYMYEFLNYIAA